MLNHKGFSLIELLITIAILLITLPLIYSSLINTQKFHSRNQQKLEKEAEFQWIEYVFRKDLKQITEWTKKSGSKLAGKTSQGTSITYTCEKKALKRTTQNQGANSNTEILNKLINITSFKILSDQPNLISIEFETDCGLKIITVRLNI